jgi:type I restriction enzyme M protein
MAKKRTKGKLAYETRSTSHADLMRSLWEAAVNLRGSIEPADYKRYVLPLVFLRFLSLRYERRRAELEMLVKEPGSEYYTEDKAVAAEILDDADEYRAAGAFVVPKPARWSSIIKIAQADDLKIKLDGILELLEKAYPQQLRGLLPRIYAGSNMDRDNLAGLINLFSRDVFTYDHGGEDIIGRVYEYFIGEFANSEGKRGGEYFTPASIVKLLVAMLEPTEGVVFDPCCGAGGMFVQSDVFTRHSGDLSFVGQESKDFTYRLCRMNLFIHGINGKIKLGNSYSDDQHARLEANYLLANPPFNDGAKSEAGWGADKIPDKDARLSLPGSKHRFTLSPRNANTMWIMHFLHHLAPGGRAGFVMATGELSSMQNARFEVRQALVENNYVDCIVQLTGQLFANTQIPCSLWFLSKGREGRTGGREREGEVLFIDGRKLGALIPGSRKQKQLSVEELEKVAAVYREFRTTGTPEAQPGFCRAAPIEEIAKHRFALTPGRYVGSDGGDEEGEPFEERMPKLLATLKEQFAESDRLRADIAESLKEFGYGS